ncbi:hypothetical protein WN51_08565 [Melipona quadrifasciata]|uniref:Uncharacterized protein n=1 Tax=Melipona quadrifasciata TaxID=166423 RepID=A0A0M9A8T4_9HYME|nr:hypothetical protein WN51_08565 [Melipona quadrifasciata]
MARRSRLRLRLRLRLTATSVKEKRDPRAEQPASGASWQQTANGRREPIAFAGGRLASALIGSRTNAKEIPTASSTVGDSWIESAQCICAALKKTRAQPAEAIEEVLG